MLKFEMNDREVKELIASGSTKQLYTEVSMLIGMVYSALDSEERAEFKNAITTLYQNNTFWKLAEKLDMRSRGVLTVSYDDEDGELVFGDADNEKAF